MFKALVSKIEQMRNNRIKVKYAIAALTDTASVVYWTGKPLEPSHSPANATQWDDEQVAKANLINLVMVSDFWNDLSPRVVKVTVTDEERE